MSATLVKVVVPHLIPPIKSQHKQQHANRADNIIVPVNGGKYTLTEWQTDSADPMTREVQCEKSRSRCSDTYWELSCKSIYLYLPTNCNDFITPLVAHLLPPYYVHAPLFCSSGPFCFPVQCPRSTRSPTYARSWLIQILTRVPLRHWCFGCAIPFSTTCGRLGHRGQLQFGISVDCKWGAQRRDSRINSQPLIRRHSKEDHSEESRSHGQIYWIKCKQEETRTFNNPVQHVMGCPIIL